MAFANIRSCPLAPGLTAIFGDFTQSLAAAPQTYAVGAGRILMVQVNPQVSAEPIDANDNLYSISVSGGINTLTLYGTSAITAGTFFMIVDNGG